MHLSVIRNLVQCHDQDIDIEISQDTDLFITSIHHVVL